MKLEERRQSADRAGGTSTRPGRRLLLIDIGNTRIKWRVRTGARNSRRQSLPLPERALPRIFARVFASAGRVDDIAVSNVAGAAVERALRSEARRRELPRPRFARTTARAAGVRNAYREPWRLGVDRWLMLLAARARHPARAVCLVSVGTALTIDLLAADGRHLGGLIAPGPALMQRSLLRDTAGIRRRARGGRGSESDAFFARSTRAAIANGALQACAALAERACRQAKRRTGAGTLLLMSGGQAGELRRQIALPARLRADLVLEGLAIWAGAEAR